MICGCNGSGKTTTAKIILPKFLEIYEYVNADEIAFKSKTYYLFT